MARWLFILFLMTGWLYASGVSADESQRELYISPEGQIYISGGTLVKKYAGNLWDVTVGGGFRWKNLFSGYMTRFESAYGMPIQGDSINEGDILEIQGRPSPDKDGFTEVWFVRDLSIKTGTPTAAKHSLVQDMLLSSTKNIYACKSAVTKAPLVQTVTTTPKGVSLSPKMALTQDLRLGMRGDEVASLQKFFQRYNLGIPNDGPVSGFFGKATEEALKRFQAANNLAASGVADAATRPLINPLLEGD